MDVSVIVIMFNPVLDKLYQTLDSIMMQKGITYEVIICDDGSQRRYKREIYEYFAEKHFDSYTFLFHEHNHGTVSNYLSGLERARGKYTKVISPGDRLAEENTLYKWIRFTEEKNAAWSFADAYYYHIVDGKEEYIIQKAQPQNIRLYLKEQRSRCIWDYVALNDLANGAATIGRTQLLFSYCKTIKEKGVLYAEDFIYHIMMFHGIVGCYYPHEAICYEYGTGISTSGKADWLARLRDDRRIANQIMFDEDEPSEFQKTIQKAISQTKRTEKIFIRGKLYYWLKLHCFPRLTKIPEKI